MTLSPGTRLGPYEITALIGTGGMGEVYRATDTSLKRQVAIKVLPASLAGDPDRLARFQREAEVLASLNHPNIAAIHGLERATGTTALVMELVEGPTLADRIAQGPIPVEEALPIATQIAEALEAAHEQGIIHRDLKPANIKLRPDGTAKVLDFGLAKALEPAVGASPGLSQSPTITTPAMTQAGVILGTAAYMSPEQARGRPVDKRTDIWAFGAVLYEILTGTRAFAGDDVTVTLARVVERDPDWTLFPAELSPTVATYIKRCLHKDPKRRIDSAHDVRLALEGAFETGGSHVADGPVVPRPALWRRALPAAGAALVTAIVVGLAAWPSSAPRPVSRSQHVLPEGRDFTISNVVRSILAMSPDGRQFVYAGTGGLYIRSMDTLEDRLISGSRVTSTNPTFSPDGAWLAFSEATRLWKIPVVGGTPVPLTVASNIFGVRWDQDDTILYNESGNILRVSADGGEPELLVGSTGAGAQLLPDGTTVLFQAPDDQVAVQSRESKAPAILFPGQGPTYLSTGHLVYVRDGVLFAVPFDARALEVTGRPVPLVYGVQGSPPQYAVSESGSLVYVASGLAGLTNTLALVDRDGRVEPLDLPPNRYRHPRLSPDGTRLAVQVAGEGGNDIWVYDLSGATAFRRLTLDGGSYPIWTPDGERITYFSRGSIYWQAADGSGVAERLTEDGSAPQPEVWSGAPQPEAWSPDGRTLSARAVVSEGTGLWTLSLDDGNALRVFYDIAGHQAVSAFSPDGKWLAYQSDAMGQPQVYVQPFPPTGEIRQVSSHEASTSPAWSKDGTELFYRAALSPGRYTIVAVGVTIDGGFTVGAARALPIEGFSVWPGIRNFDVTPDGQRFLMVFPAEPATTGESVRPTINIVENWFEELQQRVPAN